VGQSGEVSKGRADERRGRRVPPASVEKEGHEPGRRGRLQVVEAVINEDALGRTGPDALRDWSPVSRAALPRVLARAREDSVERVREPGTRQGAAGVRVIDQEVLPGVEDMQIQFGVDTDLLDTPNRGSIDRYVNPEDPILDPADPLFIPSAEILSVRVWLRIRAELRENGFTDTTNYVYADQNVAPFNDPFRRVLVSKTIYLRNARPPL